MTPLERAYHDAVFSGEQALQRCPDQGPYLQKCEAAADAAFSGASLGTLPESLALHQLERLAQTARQLPPR